MELTISSEIQGLTAARMGAVSDTASQTSVFMRASYDLTDRLGVYAGVRVFPEFTKSTNAFSAATSAVGGAIGARWSEPLTSWLAAAFELDLELLHSSTRLEIGGYSGDDGGLAFGVVPKVGLDFRLAVSPTVAIHFRPMFGYALRTSHDVSRVVVDGDHAGSTAPVNLGTTNFSGPNFSFSFGVSY